LYHGSNNQAGEIGDWPCADGETGAGVSTLEEIASLRGIRAALAASGAARLAAEGHESGVEHWVKAAQEGNETVRSLLDRVAKKLGLVISQLNRAFNPGKIILAGAFPVLGDPFLQRLQECFQEASRSADLPPLAVSDLGEFNGAIGAAALAVQKWKPGTDMPKGRRHGGASQSRV
jgi:predicted NBD/HSP70 family sugar kinase